MASTSASALAMNSAPAEARKQCMESLLKSGEFSDLKIVCGDKEFHVHRLMVSVMSSYFNASCNTAFKEGSTGVIDLSGDRVDALKSMIDYIYTSDYEIADPNDMCLHVEIYTLADKYFVAGLKQLALGKFKKASTESPSTEDLVVGLTAAYANPPLQDIELNGAIVEIARRDFERLLASERFKKTLIEFPGLALALLEDFKRRELVRHCSKCEASTEMTYNAYDQEGRCAICCTICAFSTR